MNIWLPSGDWRLITESKEQDSGMDGGKGASGQRERVTPKIARELSAQIFANMVTNAMSSGAQLCLYCS